MRHYTPKIECMCEQCGTQFQSVPSKIKQGRSKYCSRPCYDAARRNQIDCICIHCNKLFTVDPYDIKQGYGKYCSNKCQGLAQRGKNHPLWRGGESRGRGSNWSVQRKLAYNRDKGVCQHCNKKPCKGKRKFQVHHIKPYRDFNGDYESANQLTNLITLCESCHPKAEHGTIIIQPYLF